MANFLSLQDRELLQRTYRQIKEKRLAIRILCLLALDSGYTYQQIKEIFLLDDVTISDYKKRFLEGGVGKLLEMNYYGYEGKLTNLQLEELRDYLKKHMARVAKEVVEYVKQKYNIEYTEKGMVDLLHRLGFVYKKTKLVPSGACSQKQESFVQEYERLKATKGPNDKIYFVDATHPTHNAESCYGWIYKGEEKSILTNSGRQRLNINGALDSETHQIIQREDSTIDSESTVKLFQEIEAKNPSAQNIYVIADNAGYHKSSLIREYLKNSRIRLILLPPYSPNLNLIERVWKFFKEKVIKGKFYEKFHQFRQAVQNFFKDMDKYKDELKSLLTEKFHIITIDSS